MTSSSNCFRTSDNKFIGPPRMSDGRHFTDYRPSGDIDALTQYDNAISSSFYYRAYLRDHAEAIMGKNRDIAAELNFATTQTDTMLPEQSAFVSDGRTMKLQPRDPTGLGTGRQYWTQETPTAIWPMASAITRKNNCTNTADNFFYFGENEQATQQRYSSPAGGNPF